jgi:type I restriction enzyme S subunit
MSESDWEEVRLGSILHYLDERVVLDDETGYLTITVKRRHGGLEIREKLSGQQIATKKQFRLIPGAFIISRIQCWHQAYAIVGDVPPNAVASTNYDQFAISPKVAPRFFWWLSHSPAFTETVRSSAVGVVIEKMVFNRDEWLTNLVRLPPLAEQRRIVARIEELAAKIEDAKALRRQAAEEAEALVLRASAVLFEAMNFDRKPLGKAAEKRTGVAYKAEDFAESGEVPVVRLKEIGTKRPTAYLRNPDKYPNVWLEPGDIILAKTSFSTGAMCLWSGPRAVLNQNAVMLRANDNLEQRFLFAWLGYQVTRFLADHLADPNFYPYIREADLVRWLVPMPPVSEQRRIVAYLDALQAQMDALKRLQAETAAELDALLPSILDKAFKGEL